MEISLVADSLLLNHMQDEQSRTIVTLTPEWFRRGVNSRRAGSPSRADATLKRNENVKVDGAELKVFSTLFEG
jgi:hypothetical protein